LLPDPLVEAARSIGSPRLTVADLSDWLCTPSRCPAVIGGVLVYLDASHLTATYARTLAPMLKPSVTRALQAHRFRHLPVHR
jgi:hypothetical protein